MIGKKVFGIVIGSGLTVVFSLVLNCSFAQQYPVQATTIITPPYSVFLADYVSSHNDNLQLLLFLREITRTEYKIKLRVKIEGHGIRLTTKPAYLPPPIVISGGMSTALTGFDIRAYFHPNNLDFSGISKTDFDRTGKLPEGFYTFTIEVLDYGRGSVVSNLATASAWMILNDPPLINLPFNNEKLVATDPQNIFFSWTPRHTASPNAAFNTEYEFRLVELYPSNRNPDDAIRSSNSIFSLRTSLTSLNYGIAEPILIPGRSYAFRVRAIDVSGRDLFKNNGYSITHVFQYGDVCVPPKPITAEALDGTRIKITWTGLDIHTAYRLTYREKNTNWQEEPVNTDYLIIPDLKSNTDYEYCVKALCGTISGSFTSIGNVKTPEVTEPPFQCQVEPLPFELVPTELSRPLKVNDWITMTDMDIRITEITGSTNGTYNALGTAQIPMFNLAHVRIKLINIKVNDQMRVISGRYVTIYNPKSKFARTVDLTGNDNLPTTSTAELIFSGVDVTVSGDVNTVSADSASTTITVTLANNITSNIPRPLDAAGLYQEVRLTDSNGDRWIVDLNGNVRHAPSIPVAPNVLSDRSQINFSVNFTNNANHNAGLDNKDQTSLGTYDTLHIRGNVYSIPWKSVESGRTDYVNARVTGNQTFPASVGFKTPSTLLGTIPSSAPSDKTLNVEGVSSTAIDAYVLLKDQGRTDTTEVTVGRLNVVNYPRIENRLHIVPVNNAAAPSLSSLRTELTRIYGQAVAGWTVTLEPNFTIDQSYITGIDLQESGEVASYNQKMRVFNRAFKDARDLNRNDFYLFLMTGSNSARSGFMPFKRGFGYIFIDKPGINVITTIAHELGHGAFHLKHTFKEFPSIAERSTENLMDYNGGTELKKYQWDYVHDPQSMIGWLQDDEESAMTSTNFSGLIALVNSDTLKLDTIFVITNNILKLDAKRNIANGGEVKFRLTIKPEGGGADVILPPDDWKMVQNNESWVLDLNGIQEGKYILSSKVGETVNTVDFYVRTASHNYACSMCGRDLTLTQTELKNIFPNSEKIDSDPGILNHFNDALKNGGFKTCHRQAHFFSQVYEESGGMTADVEKSEYSVKRMLEIYKGNSNTKAVFFKQAFWDQKDYLNYASINLYEISADTTTTKHEGKDLQTFKWTATSTSDTVKLPTTFLQKKPSDFKKKNLNNTQKISNGKNLFNLVYANKNGNGNVNSGDGYKFRGRGAIQLTGRTTYREVSNKCNSTFSTSYNWEDNPEILESDNKAVIYSVAAFFLWKFGDLKKLDTKDVTFVTKKVNGGTNGLSTRTAKFNQYLNGRLNNCKLKK